MIALATTREDGQPVHPAFLPTAAFIAWLDSASVEKTVRFMREVAIRSKERHQEKLMREAERETAWQKLAEEAAGEDFDCTSVIRAKSGSNAPNKPRRKHVVKGKLHLIRDDVSRKRELSLVFKDGGINE